MTASEWRSPPAEAVALARRGDPNAVGDVLMAYRDQLKRVVRTRLDQRVAGRLDASDVVNEVLGGACGSVAQWLRDGKSVYACLHRSVSMRLALIHREHIGVQKRSVQREQKLSHTLSRDSVLLLCARLAAPGETPSRVVSRQETYQIVGAALDELPDVDREIVILRTLEGTPTSEVAELLGLTEGAVKMRSLRAFQRLRSRLKSLE
ncbi:MAG: sigma-70 family RNA polymerase sigma factor [Planctomycetota bacterium]